ncbi:D-alanyl-D-alanine carboxypeptidase family protein [Sphaerisporangium siamense]|uniref:D-alanyl-D-alanine carboxypeptidase (Penicillin-binding protein 5/6) n=1 Tax=Sphaerisporangium siamense TaxID=795645 RepID=A0A7W7DHR3_9ACTN|nr:D-alanyl-D-alanine carboxypeptidase [Sphaerisporangium siamense]MBB4705996.1 D-alanyl-D-alanine carboxypeptidase (penicillin-binding protein 5/6) [Sphaerisporangium siamense]
MKHVAAATALIGGLAFVAPGTAGAASEASGTRTSDDGAPIGGALLGRRDVIVGAGAKPPPKSEAASFVVADADTGQVLAAKDPHGRHAPASTLKILTAVTLIPRLNKNKLVKPSADACNVEGSAVGLTQHKIYKVHDLLRALMMVSGNDAAVALAEANGGLPRTLADMNAEAKRLQALDTVAKTPNGLDAPGQSSSAYDLALIARAGLAGADFREYVGTRIAKFPAPAGKHYEIANHNRLLGRYPGMIGVKNGYTTKALGSFVGAARRDGHTIIVAVMRHEGSFWGEVQELLDWGFASRGRVQPVGTLVPPVPEPKPTRPVGGPVKVGPAPAKPVEAAHDSPLVGIGAGVVAVALLGGAAWVVYGVRRRARAGALPGDAP